MARLAKMLRTFGLLALTVITVSLVLPEDAWAARRSGGSFSGRGGFRSPGGGSRVPMRAPRPGGGNVVVVPGGGWGWGFSPFGWGGGFGMGGASTLMLMGVVGVGALVAFRAARMARMRRLEAMGYGPDDYDRAYDEEDRLPDRAFVYKIQLGLGRSARALQGRLEQFAAEGDTGSVGGLSQLLQQVGLELLREKDSIRYGSVEAAGPMSLTNGETKLNGWALAERSRFQVERVRGADGKVRRAQAEQTKSDDVLEYLLVTLIVATRTPMPGLTKLGDLSDLDKVLHEVGGIAPDALLGLEVVWTPADPEDSLTESELLLSYPDLRSL